jgi:hypothetical protein
LTPKVLKLFLATGCEEIILAVQLLNIKQPVLPASMPAIPVPCAFYFDATAAFVFDTTSACLQGALRGERF